MHTVYLILAMYVLVSNKKSQRAHAEDYTYIMCNRIMKVSQLQNENAFELYWIYIYVYMYRRFIQPYELYTTICFA